mmetsp:Transcript_21298/g.34450  ORF Transcript_21298/g.34450 Transcript_21298/m.34450 type:complete len:587 (+) Transcript_21298:122-1882(+)
MSAKPDDSYLYHEEVEISDESENEDGKYGNVSDGESSSDNEDFTAMLSEIKSDNGAEKIEKSLQKRMDGKVVAAQGPAQAENTKKHTVIDDFIRNFLAKLGMSNTLDSFETEWYQMKQQGKFREEDIGRVPDIYVRNSEMDNQVKELRKQLAAVQKIANKAKATWGKFRKQRDYYRMHHRRVVQEKDRLLQDIKRLKKDISNFEPALAMMKTKYERAMNSASLTRIAKERSEARIQVLEQQIKSMDDGSGGGLGATSKRKSEKKRSGKRSGDALIPDDDRPNPYLNKSFDPTNAHAFKLTKTFQGHTQAISNLAIHPRKPVIATASDDRTWKLWSIPKGELILSGSGHKSWISGIDFHPKGTLLATTSGDGTVKVWDFLKAKCAMTFSEHTQPVWDCSFHDTGDFLASCSMDQTVKVWDTQSQRCRHTFRGHVDSINSVLFQPYSNNVCTGSADKSVSIWDLRSGLCIQTFVGHTNAIGSVSFNVKGDCIVSSDMDGVVKVWDVRMVGERLSIDLNVPVNDAKFDRSSRTLAVACDDGTVKIADSGDGKVMGVLTGHEKAVQALQLDPSGRFLISCGSDNTFRIWA